MGMLGMQWCSDYYKCLGWKLGCSGALWASAHKVFDVRVDSGPEHVTARKRLHAHNSGMRFVQLLENALPAPRVGLADRYAKRTH